MGLLTMVDLTKGNPAGRMVRFALPVALGNVFQLFYSLADTRIVGSTLGAEALAAVGATTSISTLLIGFINGLTNGFAVLIAQKFGAGERNEVRRSGALSFGLGILVSALLSLASTAGLSGIFNLLNVPSELTPDARAYIMVILMGIPAAMAYNGCAGILRAVGDTGAPLVFLVLASFLNVGLDLLFILRFHMGVGGAAWATVLSQTISAVLSFCYMWKTYPFFRFHLADFEPDKKRIRQLLSSGLSMALMMSLVFFGTLALQCAINTFGTNTIVAHTGARKITEFFMLPFSVMSVTMATYCGQNLGAGETGRIRQGVRYALFLTWGWSLFAIFLSYMAAPSLIYLVTGSREAEVVNTAALYLKIDTLFYFAPAAIAVLRNTLQGIGDHVTPIVSSFVELAGKTAVAFFLAPALEYMGIIMAEPIVWILMVIPLAVRYLRHPALKKALKSQ